MYYPVVILDSSFLKSERARSLPRGISEHMMTSVRSASTMRELMLMGLSKSLKNCCMLPWFVLVKQAFSCKWKLTTKSRTPDLESLPCMVSPWRRLSSWPRPWKMLWELSKWVKTGSMHRVPDVSLFKRSEGMRYLKEFPCRKVKSQQVQNGGFSATWTLPPHVMPSLQPCMSWDGLRLQLDQLEKMHGSCVPMMNLRQLTFALGVIMLQSCLFVAKLVQRHRNLSKPRSSLVPIFACALKRTLEAAQHPQRLPQGLMTSKLTSKPTLRRSLQVWFKTDWKIVT